MRSPTATRSELCDGAAQVIRRHQLTLLLDAQRPQLGQLFVARDRQLAVSSSIRQLTTLTTASPAMNAAWIAANRSALDPPE